MKTPEQNEPPPTPVEELPAPRRPRRPEDLTPSMPARPLGISGGRSRSFCLWQKRAPFEAVLDVGCGTGEHALMAAGMGLEATGIDTAPAESLLPKPKLATVA